MIKGEKFDSVNYWIYQMALKGRAIFRNRKERQMGFGGIILLTQAGKIRKLDYWLKEKVCLERTNISEQSVIIACLLKVWQRVIISTSDWYCITEGYSCVFKIMCLERHSMLDEKFDLNDECDFSYDVIGKALLE